MNTDSCGVITRSVGSLYILLLDFQVLAAMGTGFRVTRVGLAAIETGGPIGWSRRSSRERGGFLSFISVEKVEGEEDD